MSSDAWSRFLDQPIEDPVLKVPFDFSHPRDFSDFRNNPSCRCAVVPIKEQPNMATINQSDIDDALSRLTPSSNYLRSIILMLWEELKTLRAECHSVNSSSVADAQRAACDAAAGHVANALRGRHLHNPHSAKSAIYDALRPFFGTQASTFSTVTLSVGDVSETTTTVRNTTAGENIPDEAWFKAQIVEVSCAWDALCKLSDCKPYDYANLRAGFMARALCRAVHNYKPSRV